jgi:GTP-binding protein HflX
MLDRPDSGDSAVLVNLDFGDIDSRESLNELRQLANSAGLRALLTIEGRRSRPDAATFAGSGKVGEIGEAVRRTGASVVVFNHELSGAQERNLERALQIRVIDRTSLILDIFAQRASSHEGKLQVELAQLERLSTRLVRGWSHLERQTGGIGLRGPGETQLETDRRLIGRRVKLLKEKLARSSRQRAVQRRARNRADLLKISLVGYTNAGKSTLFNSLTHGHSFTADQLFATLDTTTRKVYVSAEDAVVISDTVGFIRHLPHTLVAAFRATLEETIQADLLVHVVDASSPTREQQIQEVNAVLGEIGADRIPQLMVYNKIDLAPHMSSGYERDEYGRIHCARSSALTGAGLDILRLALAEHSVAARAAHANTERPDTVPAHYGIAG